MTFAAKLKQVMQEKFPYMRAGDLAQQAGIPQPTLAMYTLGRCKPSFYNVVKICRALGVPLETFADCEFKGYKKRQKA